MTCSSATNWAGHDAFTVAFMGWKGLKNGALLAKAAMDRFEALITTDQNIAYQQNASSLPCAIVILIAKSNDIDDLKPLVPNLLRELSHLRPNTIVHVHA